VILTVKKSLKIGQYLMKYENLPIFGLSCIYSRSGCITRQAYCW